MTRPFFLRVLLGPDTNLFVPVPRRFDPTGSRKTTRQRWSRQASRLSATISQGTFFCVTDAQKIFYLSNQKISAARFASQIQPGHASGGQMYVQRKPRLTERDEAISYFVLAGYGCFDTVPHSFWMADTEEGSHQFSSPTRFTSPYSLDDPA